MSSRFTIPTAVSIPIIASGAPLKNELGHVTGAVVAFQDISRLREVDRMKEEFVSIVSHELRTPLTSIRGSIQLVLGDAGLGSRPGDIATCCRSRSTTASAWCASSTTSSTSSKIESGNLTLHKKAVNVAELMRQSVDVVQSPARNANVTLDVEAAGRPPAGDGRSGPHHPGARQPALERGEVRAVRIHRHGDGQRTRSDGDHRGRRIRARALRPRISIACSGNSSRSTARRRGARAAPASAWPSPRPSSNSTAAASSSIAS